MLSTWINDPVYKFQIERIFWFPFYFMKYFFIHFWRSQLWQCKNYITRFTILNLHLKMVTLDEPMKTQHMGIGKKSTCNYLEMVYKSENRHNIMDHLQPRVHIHKLIWFLSGLVSEYSFRDDVRVTTY